MRMDEEGQTLNMLYIKQDITYEVSIINQGRYVTSLFLQNLFDVNRWGRGGISCDYPWGMQPDAIEHQTLLLINKVTSVNAFAWLSLMLRIFHTHKKISLEMTSGTC